MTKLTKRQKHRDVPVGDYAHREWHLLAFLAPTVGLIAFAMLLWLYALGPAELDIRLVLQRLPRDENRVVGVLIRGNGEIVIFGQSYATASDADKRALNHYLATALLTRSEMVTVQVEDSARYQLLIMVLAWIIHEAKKEAEFGVH